MGAEDLKPAGRYSGLTRGAETRGIMSHSDYELFAVAPDDTETPVELNFDGTPGGLCPTPDCIVRSENFANGDWTEITVRLPESAGRN